MRVMVTIGALLIAMPAGAQPPCQQELYSEGRPYRSCIAARAKQLEPSGESPNDIATAALDGCQGESETSKRIIDACVGRSVGDRTWEKVQALLRADLVNLVVSLRARQHSGG